MRFLRPGLAAMMLCALVASAPARAAYPERPIHLVVPFGAGSAPDIVARLLADHLGPRLGVPIVVENLPGAAGTLAVDHVAKAAPDGYTLVLSGDAALVLAGGAGTPLPYAPLTDLAPISQVVVTPNVLVVGAEVPARTVDGLIALVRAHPGAYNCAHLGSGTSSQRGCRLLAERAGLQMEQVPYVRSPLTDVVAGHVQIFFGNVATALPFVRDGRLKALAMSSLKRSPVVPDIPTLAETGLPGFEAVAWFGLLAPAGTPDEVVQRLGLEVRQVLQENAVHARLIELGTEPVGSSPQDFAALLKTETQRWSTNPMPAPSAPR